MAARGNGQRIFILVIVGVFLLSTLAFTGAIIYDQLNQPNTEDLQAQLEEQQNQAQENQEPKEGQLKGTKLAGFTPVEKVETLQVIDTKVGEGKEVPKDGTVTAHYTGALAKDGTIFESSYDSGNPASFPLSNVIKGWQEGVPGMKEGGERRIIIPAAMAYGESGSSSIPPNSDLVFDIVLVSVGQ